MRRNSQNARSSKFWPPLRPARWLRALRRDRLVSRRFVGGCGFGSFQRGVVNAEIVLGGSVAGSGGAAEPLDRFPDILRHPMPGFITQTQVALGRRAFLFRRRPVPFYRFFIILGHDLAGFVKDPQVELSLRFALFGGRVVPFYRFGVILRDSLSGFVENAQVELCGRVPLFGGFPEPLGSLAEFLWHPGACLVTIAEVALSGRIILVGSAAKPLHRLRIVLRHPLAGLVSDAQRALGNRVPLFRGFAEFFKTLPCATVSLRHTTQDEPVKLGGTRWLATFTIAVLASNIRTKSLISSHQLRSRARQGGGCAEAPPSRLPAGLPRCLLVRTKGHVSEPIAKVAGVSRGTPAVIYVVDDEAMLLELAAVILAPLGYEIQTFRDPEAALQAFTRAQPRPLLLITDFAMHRMNGMALIEACRRVEPSQKILMISGTVGPEIYQGAKVRPDRFLAKPYQAQELIEIVKTMIKD